VTDVDVDLTAPAVSFTSAEGTEGANGWYTSAVTATFTATDATSGPTSATDTATSTSDGDAVSVDSPAFSDVAGNTAQVGSSSKQFKIDTTAPTAITWTGGPAAGSTHWGTQVPANPSCDASDTTSGLASCTVTGRSTEAGTHTLTATAKDKAGNTSTSTRSYTVQDMTFTGFYSPADMGGVINTVKGGSTVPLKFNIQIDGVQQTSTALVTAFSATKTACVAASTDDVEIISTGNTVLRYDGTAAAGQYIQNWKTPTGAGICYLATATLADGDKISALFKLK
jgi:hypothetical protein